MASRSMTTVLQRLTKESPASRAVMPTMSNCSNSPACFASLATLTKPDGQFGFHQKITCRLGSMGKIFRRPHDLLLQSFGPVIVHQDHIGAAINATGDFKVLLPQPMALR